MFGVISLVTLICLTTELKAGARDEWTGIIGVPLERLTHVKLDSIVAGWTNTSLTYPEEMTAVGDVLAAFHVDKRGIIIHKWPDGIIPYVIEHTFSPEQKGMIMHAMSVIQILTCIRFILRTDEIDYLSIENKHGCKSFYGRFGKRQELYLQAPACVTKIRTVYHELLHAIGLIHEHTRTNRNAYVSINCKNLGKRNSEQLISYAINNMVVDIYGFNLPYDYSSVMHYTEYAGSINGNKTIIPKDKYWIGRIGQTEQPSEIDIIRINLMYNCNSQTLCYSPEDKTFLSIFHLNV